MQTTPPVGYDMKALQALVQCAQGTHWIVHIPKSYKEQF